jgi:hypothetical protein
MKPTLNILPVLHYAWTLYQKSFLKLFSIAFVAAMLSQLLVLNFPTDALSAQDASQIHLSGWFVAAAIAASILMLWCHSTLQVLIYAQHSHTRLSLTQALLFTLKKLPMIISNGFMFTILLMLGLMLYIVPGILIATVLMLYLPVMLFEHQWGFRAFVTSFQWIKPFFFQLFPLTILILMLLIIPSVLPMLSQYGLTATNINLERGIEIVLTGLLFPLANALIVSLYIALKTYQQRKKV